VPFKKLSLEVVNRVGYILLDAGSRFNKLSITTIRELKRAFLQVEADQAVHVIVLSGYPGESFAVGADIGQMVHFSPSDAFHFSELGQSLFEQIESCPKPVIGALNGIAEGHGYSENAFTVAYLKRALDHLHKSHAGLEAAAPKRLLPDAVVAEVRAELLAIREGILRLMDEFRGRR